VLCGQSIIWCREARRLQSLLLLLGLLFVRLRVQVPDRFNAIVENPDDLNEIWSHDAVEQNVGGLFHSRLATDTRMPEMEAPNSVGQLGAVARRSATRVGRYFAHSRCQERSVALPAVVSPSFGADREDLSEIASSQW
jgi:hypothetical protein